MRNDSISIPVVSVIMITYGHEKYICQAIEGVLMQQCDFEVELIIANDCSPDDTGVLIDHILKNDSRSSCIKYFKHDKNLGMMPNFIFAMEKSKGKYVALCEGDDYWIDPLKLQKQVNFLERNSDYVIHSGVAQLMKKKTITNELYGFSNEKKIFEIKDFLRQNPIITCTVMFRNCLMIFPKVFRDITFGDWFLYILLMSSTGLKSFRSIEIYSVYRIHPGGIMSNLSEMKYCNAHIFQIIQIKRAIGYLEYPEDILQTLNRYSLQSFKFAINNKQYVSASSIFWLNLRESNFKTPFIKYLRVMKEYFIIYK